MSQAWMKQKEDKEEKEKKKVVGWSANVLENVTTMRELKEWCSGEAPARKKQTVCGKNCARKWRRKSWRSTESRRGKRYQPRK